MVIADQSVFSLSCVHVFLFSSTCHSRLHLQRGVVSIVPYTLTPSPCWWSDAWCTLEAFERHFLSMLPLGFFSPSSQYHSRTVEINVEHKDPMVVSSNVEFSAIRALFLQLCTVPAGERPKSHSTVKEVEGCTTGHPGCWDGRDLRLEFPFPNVFFSVFA